MAKRPHIARTVRSAPGLAAPALLIAAILLAAGTLGASPSRSQDVALESFGGQWVFNSSAQDLRSLEQGIDHAVDQMNIFIREIARLEIRRRITPEQRLRLEVADEEGIQLTLDDWGPVALRLDGSARSVPGPEGSTVRVSARYQNGRITQRQIQSQGTRQNVFTLNGDASRLTMAVSIGADQLPADIRYRLSFRRAR